MQRRLFRAMASGRNGIFGLLAVAWIAIAVAATAIPFTPESYCGELGTPPGLNVTLFRLILAR